MELQCSPDIVGICPGAMPQTSDDIAFVHLELGLERGSDAGLNPAALALAHSILQVLTYREDIVEQLKITRSDLEAALARVDELLSSRNLIPT